MPRRGSARRTWVIVAVTVGVALGVGGGVIVLAARDVVVGPSCCQTPSTTVTEYSAAVIGYGYTSTTSDSTAVTMACSRETHAQASAALRDQVTPGNGRRPNSLKTFTTSATGRPEGDGGQVMTARIEVTVSLGGMTSATGYLYADVVIRPRGDGRWCVQSWTPTKETP